MQQESKMAGLVAGLLLLIVAGLIAWSTSQMRIATIHAKVGPQVFPYVTSFALAIVGGLLMWQAIRLHPGRLMPDTERADWRAVAIICAGFVIEIVLLKPLGFVLASTILFTAVSFAFGSRKIVRDVIIALVLSAAVYLLFTKMLNLQLPAGILKGLV